MNHWNFSRDNLPIHEQAVWVTAGEGLAVHEATYVIKNGMPHVYMVHPEITTPLDFFYWQPRVVTDKPSPMRGPLTPKEFAKAMDALDNGEAEEDHGNADELMCDLLRSLGYGEGVEVFETMTKYYA